MDGRRSCSVGCLGVIVALQMLITVPFGDHVGLISAGMSVGHRRGHGQRSKCRPGDKLHTPTPCSSPLVVDLHQLINFPVYALQRRRTLVPGWGWMWL
jgi:hypothetical protein